MSYQIREMQPQDYQAAIHLWQTLPGIGLSSADKEEALLAFLDKNPRTCFTAFDGNTLTGTILGGSDGRRGYLYHLAVLNDYQKQGLGRQLVQTCLQALKAEGIEKCHIFVLADNQDGMLFWQKEGWLQRDDILVMSKNL